MVLVVGSVMLRIGDAWKGLGIIWDQPKASFMAILGCRR